VARAQQQQQKEVHNDQQQGTPVTLIISQPFVGSISCACKYFVY
jgi:hypothetical protein